MKSVSFLMETGYLPEIFLSAQIESESRNRVFRLQQGETIRIRSLHDDENYLYLLGGVIKIDSPDSTVTLQGKKKIAPVAYRLPDSDSYFEVESLEDSLVFQADEKRFDDILTWVSIAQSLESDPRRLDMLARAVRVKSLSNLSVESIFELVSRMEIKDVSKGTDVVSQGEEADYFYIIQKGSAEVWSMDLYDDEPQLVNRLSAGDSFGEDALVTGGSRNATVRMATNGVLLVGAREDFEELVARPCIDEVGGEAALALLNEENYAVLDVRYEEEWEESRIPGCQHISLPELRARYEELDPAQRYLIYCRSGKRSAVAALILKRRGFDCMSLRGGIKQWAYQTESSD